MIKMTGYPEGSDISIFNTFYLYPRKNQETGKWDSGSLTVICKDNKTNKKFQQTFKNPKYDYYITKDDFNVQNRLYFAKKENLEKVEVPYKDLQKDIAERTNNLDFFYENIRNGNRRENNKLHSNIRLFNSDMNIEDKVRFNFSNYYTNTPNSNITKAFFDIEVDGIHQAGDFPEPGECPINAVSYISNVDKTIYVFLLRNKENPLIEEFEKSVNNDLILELKEFIKNKVGGWKNEIRYGLKDMRIKFLFYEKEIDLIKDIFVVNNFTKPDFLLAWNMAFDIPYIIQRIKNLGYNPENIMCHPDFKDKVCRYYIDNQKGKDGKEKDFGKRGDFATIASYTVFLDQLIQFASRRSNQSKFPNMKLDFIGEIVGNVRKLDYSDITNKIAELPYKNYKRFVFYNIMDTIVQLVIEHKCKDIDYVYNKSIINNTRYSKVHRQVTYLPNRLTKELDKKDLVIGNNPNSSNKKSDEKFDGAYVAASTHINDYSKLKIDGLNLDIYDNLIDFDYKSQYPNEVRENNIAAFTQIGRIIIEEAIYKGENPFKKKKYHRGGSFLEDLDTHNWLEFCSRWLHLAPYDDLYDDVINYCTNISPSFRFANLYTGKLQECYRRIPKEENRTVIRKLSDEERKENMSVCYIKHYLSEEQKNLSKNIKIDEVVYRDGIRTAK